MKYPRIKLYKEVEGFKVFIVDGAEIRKNLNSEFTNFAQHYRFQDMIPKNEFWVDRSKGHDEYGFYIQNMLTENDLMEKGYNYYNAHQKSCEVEQKARDNQPKKDIKIGIIKKVGDTEIWLVDGEQVRNRYYTDFAQGGHDLVYRWIPDKEVWIDNDIPVEERDEIIVHECYERDKMEGGRNYIQAHKGASKVEQKYRKTKKPRFKFKGIIPMLKGMRKKKGE